jgi:hypothetical protein
MTKLMASDSGNGPDLRGLSTGGTGLAMYLLDVNILIALADPNHIHHGRARGWFLSEHREAWATCPLTENGFIRILGHASYRHGQFATFDKRIKAGIIPGGTAAYFLVP